MFVVGATGVMNAFATPLFGIWQMTDVKQVLAPYNQPTPVTPVADLQKAVNDAEAAAPGSKLDYVSFPAIFYSSPVHYLVWLKGDRTLTSRMQTPVLINATTDKVDAVAQMPWYLKALEVSRPLHFGDYGGILLKVLWAALDIGTIAVLVTGLYLWVAKRRWSTKSADLIAVEAAVTGRRHEQTDCNLGRAARHRRRNHGRPDRRSFFAGRHRQGGSVLCAGRACAGGGLETAAANLNGARRPSDRSTPPVRGRRSC
jgi:uncharacterized iron-regulated membrane protein